jgi:TolA-binding protein
MTKGAKTTTDDAAYFAALDAERAGDLAGAREKYLAIVRAAPPSKRLGEAYFGLGEIYLAEAASDAAKLDLAAMAFGKARAALAPKSTLAAIAAERQSLATSASRSRGR